MPRRIWLIAGTLVGLVLSLTYGVAPAAAHPPEQDGRPALPNPQTYGTTHFLIHYTLGGSQAVDPADGDSSGVPDYVELVGETMEHVWLVEVDQMGWPAPANDRGEGGDERIDVYLEELLSGGYAGYTDTYSGFLGDNPNSEEKERHAAYGYMSLDNDYLDVDEEWNETPTDLMQVTVAHEFNHLIQAGIDDNDLYYWLYEATATWMEDEVYPDVDDGVYYLDSVFKSPDVCLVAEYARGDDLHWYGEWLLLRLISERYGPDIIRVVWENMRRMSGFESLDAALALYDSSLEAETRDYAVANLLRAYEEGYLYPTVLVEGTLEDGSYVPENGVQSLGADYIQLAGSQPLAVSLDSAEVPVTVRAVGVRDGEAVVVEMSNGHLVIDPSEYDDTYIIIHNDERAANNGGCYFANYSLSAAPTSESPTPASNAWIAEYYVSPSDEPVSSTNGDTNIVHPSDQPYVSGTDHALSPSELDVSFETIIPEQLPAGYTFDSAYIMTAAEFGDNAVYYVPGGGDSANFDYLDSSGNWLSVAESTSHYVTLQQWLDDIEYETPGEILPVADVLVLVEDLSDSSGVWVSATLILDGLFIVVDSDHNQETVIATVEELVRVSQEGAATVEPVEVPTDRPPAENPPVDTPVVTPPVETAPIGQISAMTKTSFVICTAGICLAGVLIPMVVIGAVRHRRRNRSLSYRL
jgi:hypothetical protein